MGGMGRMGRMGRMGNANNEFLVRMLDLVPRCDTVVASVAGEEERAKRFCRFPVAGGGVVL